MIEILKWYLAISILGWSAFPLTFRLLPGLRDRGFAVSRVVGLLLWGFIFWLLATLHILQNSTGGVLAGYAILLVVSGYVLYRTGWKDIWEWIKENRRTVITVEALFLAAFVFWAFMRSVNPSIDGTEKPMEMAFITSILRSPSFPPADPWLSGYAISYYYFGYVMIAMITRVTAVSPEVAFTLASALWFALCALGTYSIIYNLVSFCIPKKDANGKITNPIFSGLLGPFFLLLVSNAEGVIEMLYSKGLFWTTAADGTATSSFWSWLNLRFLTSPPAQDYSWIPTRYMWWWQGSRVVQDVNLLGNPTEIIDEFPFFSFILSDLHPHVLALPFALLAVAIALNLYMRGKEGSLPGSRIIDWLVTPYFWFSAIVIGSLAFMNIWDFPVYLAFYAAAFGLVRFEKNGWNFKLLAEIAMFGLVHGLVGYLLFLPYHLSFASQAQGITPSLDYFTRGNQFWLMFLPLLVPIIVFLFWLWGKNRTRIKVSRGFQFSAWVVGGLWVLSYFVAWINLRLIDVGQWLTGLSGTALDGLGGRLTAAGQSFLSLHGNYDPTMLLGLSLAERFTQPGTWVTLAIVIFLIWGLLSARLDKPEDETVNTRTVPFVLLLALLGAGVVLFPDFFYLRDFFGSRINSIFKFYYQGWMVWSLAAAFATAMVFHWAKGIRKTIMTIIISLAIASGLMYTVFCLYTETDNFHPSDLSLDGMGFIRTYLPDEAAAIEWFRQAPYGVVAEGVGGAYDPPSVRISTFSGLPQVLGWTNHESQWRGGYTEMGTREADMELLYSTPSWDDALRIINQYDIRYIYVGPYEQENYRVSTEKFAGHLTVVFQSGSVTIYEVPQTLLSQ